MEYLTEYSFFKRKKYVDIPMEFLYYRNDNIYRFDSVQSIFTIYLKIKRNTFLYIGRLVCNDDLTHASFFNIDSLFDSTIEGLGNFCSINDVQYRSINKTLNEFKKSKFNKKTWSEYIQDKFMDEDFITNEIERMIKVKEQNKKFDPYNEEQWEDENN